MQSYTPETFVTRYIRYQDKPNGQEASPDEKAELSEMYYAECLRILIPDIDDTWLLRHKDREPEWVPDVKLWPKDKGTDGFYRTKRGTFGIFQCKWRADIFEQFTYTGLSKFYANVGTFKNLSHLNCEKCFIITNTIQNIDPDLTYDTAHIDDQWMYDNMVVWIGYKDVTHPVCQDAVNKTLARLNITNGLSNIQPTKLRYYQEDVLNLLDRNNPSASHWIEDKGKIRIRRRTSRGIFKLACGSGKTKIMIFHVIRTMKKSDIFIFASPYINLIDQSKNDFMSEFRKTNTEAICYVFASRGNNSTIVDTDSNRVREFCITGSSPKVILVTHKSLPKLIEALDGIKITTIFYDEAHILWSHFHTSHIHELDCNHFYFTATPSEDMENKTVFGNLLYQYPLGKGIADGYLHDFMIMTIGIANDELFKEAIGLEQKQSKNELANQMHANILVNLLKDGKIRKPLVFCSGIKDADEICRYVKTKIKTCFSITGNTKDRERKHIEFTNADVAVIFSVDIYKVGVDIECIDSVYFAATMGEIPTIQSVCRAVRIHQSKDGRDVYVILPVVTDGTYTNVSRADYRRVADTIKHLATVDSRFYKSKDESMRINTKNVLKTVIYKSGSSSNEDVSELIYNGQDGDIDFMFKKFNEAICYKIYRKEGDDISQMEDGWFNWTLLYFLGVCDKNGIFKVSQKEDSPMYIESRVLHEALSKLGKGKSNAKWPEKSMSKALTEDIVLKCGFAERIDTGKYKIKYPNPNREQFKEMFKVYPYASVFDNFPFKDRLQHLINQ